ncbi:FAD-dependent oxidoreductase [Nocardioides sp.]|uniref:NAD(P)/FAD-dependent oxidoreductase n=1 Tax=Nocardioides sp. TaxID=35761 RepID=UPI00261043F1|nr:FAD-dependent oxidoreductase [Nocardioides sp.]
MSILVVGASVAGLRTVQALRMKGYSGPITLLGEEPHPPYDKPPLSKEMLLPDGDGEAILLATEEQLTELDVDLRLGVRAAALDVAARTVTTVDGEAVGFERLVIATGATPRRLPGTEHLAGVHTIRTAEDAVALRTALPGASDVVVVGAGFIGAEFAAAVRLHGATATLVEAQTVPLAHVLGAEVGRRLADIHAAQGNTLLTGIGVAHIEGDERVQAVVLTDGRRLPADLVVVGIGAVPATDWLESSGLPIADGVECEADLRVIGTDGIYAAGDVARWPHAHYGFDVRIEHWTNANEHADLVASAITGSPPPRTQLPYVWSDQYGHRIQIVGRPNMGRSAHLVGTVADGDLLAAFTDEGGALVGAVVVDDVRAFMKCRKAIAARAPWTGVGLVATR